MIEYFKNLDKEIFILVNSAHNSFFDAVMYLVSHRFFWIPLYVFILYFVIKKFKTQTWIILGSILLLITLTDQISVHFFKNIFLRYRPCHNIELKNIVHTLNNHCGGMYGFVSSHAANTFGLATFLSFLFSNKKWTVFFILWASVVSYSRIYAGVHYPFDVLAGALLGMMVGYFVFFGIKKFVLKF